MFSDDEMNWIKDQWVSGKSAAKIEAEWARTRPHRAPLSRNAVLGLAFRREWKRAKVEPIERALEPLTQKPVAPSKPTIVAVPRDPLSRDVPPCADTAKRLGDLGVNECHWPFDLRCEETGQNFIFCAAGTAPGACYCPHHTAVASGGRPAMRPPLEARTGKKTFEAFDKRHSAAS